MISRMWLRVLVYGLLFLIFVVLSYWVLSKYESYEEVFRSGFSSEARRNPLLAVEQFLRRLGYDVESRPGHLLLRNLPPPGDVLIVSRIGVPLSQKRRSDLVAWLEQGGQLMVGASQPWDEDDPEPQGFLEEFGVRLREMNIAQWLALDPKATNIELIPIDFRGYDEPLDVAFEYRPYLEELWEEASGRVSGSYGYKLLQFDVGEGLLTVTSDSGFLTNRHIGEHDHALYLSMLLPDPGGKIWLLFDSAMPSLHLVLWRRAPELIVALCVLLALLVWRSASRLGPLLPRSQNARRNLMEHIEASAHYHWRIDKGKAMVDITRHKVVQHWLRRHLRLRDMDLQDRCIWISEHSKLSAEEIHRTLYGEFRGEREFIEISRNLKMLMVA